MLYFRTIFLLHFNVPFGSPFGSPFWICLWIPFWIPFEPFEALLYFKTYVQVMIKQFEGMGIFRLFFDKIGHSGPCHSVHFRDNKAFEGYFCHYCLNSWPFCVKKSVSLVGLQNHSQSQWWQSDFFIIILVWTKNKSKLHFCLQKEIRWPYLSG